MPKAKTASTGQVQPAPEPAPTVQFDAESGARWVLLKFDDAGYPGWWARVRVNISTRDWQAVLAKELEPVWEVMGRAVLAWNWTEEGQPIKLPRDGLTAEELPRDLFLPLVSKYVTAVILVAAAPKG